MGLSRWSFRRNPNYFAAVVIMVLSEKSFFKIYSHQNSVRTENTSYLALTEARIGTWARTCSVQLAPWPMLCRTQEWLGYTLQISFSRAFWSNEAIIPSPRSIRWASARMIFTLWPVSDSVVVAALAEQLASLGRTHAWGQKMYCQGQKNCPECHAIVHISHSECFLAMQFESGESADWLKDGSWSASTATAYYSMG